MARINFIDTVIRAIKAPDKGQVTYWAIGIPGLGVRVGTSGAKSFISKISVEGKDKLITHGRYPKIKLREAIDKHNEMLGRVEQGLPLVDDQEASDVKKVAGLGDDYFAMRRAHGYKDIANQENIFKKDIAAWIGHLLPDKVTSKDVRNCLDKTLARIQAERVGVKGAGQSHIRHVQVVLRGFFKHLVAQGICAQNPALAVETVGVARVRERVLTPPEIYKFWHGLSFTGLSDPVVTALRLVLVTGQRSKEVLSLKWADISESGDVWSITAETAKNKRMHRVVLGSLAREVIASARPAKYERPDADIYVCGGGAPLSERALSKALARNRDRMGIGDVTPHDLRRTAATLVTAMGLPSFYASLLLNHTQQGVTNRVYVQYSYDAEKRKAVDVLDAALKMIVSAASGDAVPSMEKIRSQIVISSSA